MMTVNQVSRLVGVSIRTLHYYDEIGLLVPPVTTDAGYRLYDDTSLERLQSIMLFKELEFPLKEIKKIIDSSDFDKNKALNQQIELLILKKERIENLIKFAEGLKNIGVDNMNFEVFDTKKIDEFTKKAKESWGETKEFKEFEQKTANYTQDKKKALNIEMMNLFVEFGKMLDRNPDELIVQEQVKKLQDFITDSYYKCTKQILSSLGQMYVENNEMKSNIDNAGGEGTAEFVSSAIAIYCK